MTPTIVRDARTWAALPLSQRLRVYPDKALVRAVPPPEQDDEPLVDLARVPDLPFALRPIWDDPPPRCDDPALAALAAVESDVLRAYVGTHPDFSVAVRAGVLERLRAAQAALPTGTMLAIAIGYRPVAVQRTLLVRVRDGIHALHPELDDAGVGLEASRYVADPDVDVPPHATGGAVDLTVLGPDGTPLDMGSPLNAPELRSWTFTDAPLTHQQRANRALLTSAMAGAGFANLASEWWHFSFGDPRWALFTGAPRALYRALPDSV